MGNSPFEKLATNVRHALQDKTISILLVGVHGVGKSTLVNTVLMKRVCWWTGAYRVSNDVNVQTIPISLGDGDQCTLTVINTPGRTGNRRKDAMLREELTKWKDVDIILACFDLMYNGGYYRYCDVYESLELLCTIFGDETMEKRAMIVLTKENLLSTEITNDDEVMRMGPESVEQIVKEWTLLHREEATERSQDGEDHALCLRRLPTQVAGVLPFDIHDNPDVENMAKIDGQTTWHSELWKAVAEHSGGGLATLMYNLAGRLDKSKFGGAGTKMNP